MNGTGAITCFIPYALHRSLHIPACAERKHVSTPACYDTPLCGPNLFSGGFQGSSSVSSGFGNVGKLGCCSGT